MEKSVSLQTCTHAQHRIWRLAGTECMNDGYTREDGKCFLMDFWVFPEYRGNGMGHRCFKAFEERTRAEGAKYYEINSTKEDSVRFWKSLGFVENGKDEYDMPLFIKR